MFQSVINTIDDLFEREHHMSQALESALAEARQSAINRIGIRSNPPSGLTRHDDACKQHEAHMRNLIEAMEDAEQAVHDTWVEPIEPAPEQSETVAKKKYGKKEQPQLDAEVTDE